MAEEFAALGGSVVRDHVLDATALLCVLFAEEGWDQIESLLPRASISAVTYHEVLTKLDDLGVSMGEARAIIDALDVHIVAVDRKQTDLGTRFRDGSGSKSLSLGERSCLALTKMLQAVAVTTDREWTRFDLGVKINVIHQTTAPS
ncbi:MAG: type II toxin-antitoxin system VapC family toxin [Sphingomonadales bacterium]|nr:type II toxin-antitoxin system VapC family toxin [Sphingomonadales bacterium]MDE2169407.1 type II toxin-antitoxin system VapC family toxin [Sphingomonadales bacterium]